MRTTLAILAGVLLAAEARAQPNILEPPPTAFVAPGRLFSVNLPGKWQVILGDDPYTIQFKVPQPGDALMFIRRIVVPSGAHPNQVALNALETRLSAIPGFKLIKKRKVTVGGHKGASIIAKYLYQGNIQFPRALEEVYIVVGGEAFIFHFECFEPAAPRFARQLNKFYASFVPRPPADLDGPFTTEESAYPEVDKLPF